MMEIGIQADKKQAEKIRRYLIEMNLLKKDLKIKKDEKFVYFPVKNLPKDNKKYKFSRMDFERIEKKPKSYKEILDLPEKFIEKLPTSFDIIGNIVNIKIPEELNRYKNKIGEALIKANSNIKTVCATSSISGEFRTRDIEIISGEKNTKTIHREYGLKFYLDIKKTYFSPRLADERRRIANLVENDEIIIDMFTGVAPFSIMIAKYASPKLIYAFDNNRDAIDFAKINVKLNNVIDKIEIFCADSKNLKNILGKKLSKVDRIIMNLPFSAHEFFPYALKLISDKCIIHYYAIIEEEKLCEKMDELEKIARDNNISLIKKDIRKLKSYSPREFYIGIDITAKKK
jgi:tRNA (guanine37-N1)-methyltransferase